MSKQQQQQQQLRVCCCASDSHAPVTKVTSSTQLSLRDEPPALDHTNKTALKQRSKPKGSESLADEWVRLLPRTHLSYSTTHALTWLLGVCCTSTYARFHPLPIPLPSCHTNSSDSSPSSLQATSKLSAWPRSKQLLLLLLLLGMGLLRACGPLRQALPCRSMYTRASVPALRTSPVCTVTCSMHRHSWRQHCVVAHEAKPSVCDTQVTMFPSPSSVVRPVGRSVKQVQASSFADMHGICTH